MAITLSRGNENKEVATDAQATQVVQDAPQKVITLKKGANISLSKEAPGLRKILVGLGWDVNKYHGNEDFDLDVSAFMLGSDGKVISNAEFIFYGQPEHYTGAVVYSGDNRTGAGDGDDETLKIDLSKIKPEVQKIAITISIDQAKSRSQTFGNVDNSYIRIVNDETNEEVVRYDLTEEYSLENALCAGELYRYNGEWKFKAVGAGFTNELKGFTDMYGVILG